MTPSAVEPLLPLCLCGKEMRQDDTIRNAFICDCHIVLYVDLDYQVEFLSDAMTSAHVKYNGMYVIDPHTQKRVQLVHGLAGHIIVTCLV